MTDETSHPATLVAADAVDAMRLERRVAEVVDSPLNIAAVVQEAHRMGQLVGQRVWVGHRTCRICGCIDSEACEGGCWWVEGDLCSACAAP